MDYAINHRISYYLELFITEILQATFSNTFQLKMSLCQVKFNSKCIPMIYWTINQHWSGNCLVLNSQHVITGTNDDSFHWCISTPLSLNGLKCHFADIFLMKFHNRKKCNFEYNFTEVSSYWSNWHYMFGSGIGLATDWWQAITLTNDDKIFVTIWCHQASMS